MNYKKLIKKVAEHYHTTPAQVDKEIKKSHTTIRLHYVSGKVYQNVH